MDAANPVFFSRFSAECITTALQDSPVVTVIGPRQCGKTTLVQQFLNRDREYVTLDHGTALEAARSDPTGFVRSFDRVIIDEIQRAPDLLRAIKVSVDQNRVPGRFLLTGSANVLTLPRVSESLAGRMEIVSLLPLSRAEIAGKKPTFLEAALTGKVSKAADIKIGPDLVESVLIGGYPEMLRRTDERRRHAWASAYVNSLIQRDVRDIVEVEKLDQMSKLLKVLAHHSGHLINFTQIGGQIGLNDKTTRRYATVLEQLFLLRRVEPWFHNKLKRLVKTPKMHFLDSGLLAAILGLDAGRIANNRSAFGQLLETFVFSELLKQTAWLSTACALYHYRDKDQDEVDIILENNDGTVVGIEVKASATVNTGDFKGLRKLADACGKSFGLGVVLYDSDKTVPFGHRLFATPISCLWA